MIRRALVLAAAAAAVAAVLAGVATAKVITPCKPNVHFGYIKTNGVLFRTFCGSAKATLVTGGKTYKWKNGICQRPAVAFVMGFGKETLGKNGSNPLSTALTLSSGALRDGKWAALVDWQRPGKVVSAKGTVSLRDKRTRGSFTGHVIKPSGSPTGPKLTLSFTCK